MASLESSKKTETSSVTTTNSATSSPTLSTISTTSEPLSPVSLNEETKTLTDTANKQGDITVEDQQKAEEFKVKGNNYFKDHDFELALEQYSKAIESNPLNAVYYSNRAFCHIKLENYGSAVEDASKAISIDNKFVKGYYRRGTAYFAMIKNRDALQDFSQVIRMNPKDPDAQKKFKECQKAFRLEQFAKAIEGEKSKPASERVQVESIQVEESYDGPRLNGPITLEFVQEMMNHFKAQKRLHKRYVYEILLQVLKILSALPTLVEIDIPSDENNNKKHVTVCGDVHGQYYDLLNIFQLNGLPSPTNPYLFNGDFVDRGSFSFEVIMTLFAFKVLYPNHLHLSRGNHESGTMNQIYGFQGEVVSKVDALAYELFEQVFCWLPLASLINKKVLVVHGGLFSTDHVTLDDIRAIHRNRQPPDSGLMCEILWSDPQPFNGRAPSKRGVGLSFGPDVTTRFLRDNNLELLVRSHEVKMNGYEEGHNGKCITVFSAPNYCDQMGNKGAFIHFGSDCKPKFTVFDAVPHPSVQPMKYANPMFSM